MKTLLVYYSLSGNTKAIAEMFKKELDCDVAEIKTVDAYEGDYNTIVDRGQDEVNSGFMPAIEPLGVDLGEYDTVIIGTPVWWYTFAPAVKTFLASSDFRGKTVYPFATNGGWIGHTFRDFTKECKGATVRSGLNIRFNENTLVTSKEDIEKYIGSLK